MALDQPLSCFFTSSSGYSEASHASAYASLFELVRRQPVGHTFAVNPEDVGLSLDRFRDFALALAAANGSTGMDVIGMSRALPSTPRKSERLICKRIPDFDRP